MTLTKDSLDFMIPSMIRARRKKIVRIDMSLVSVPHRGSSLPPEIGEEQVAVEALKRRRFQVYRHRLLYGFEHGPSHNVEATATV